MRKRNLNMTATEIKLLQYLQQRETMIVPASIREIAKDLQISSTSVVDYHLDRLEEFGKIKRTKGVSRFIKLVKE